MNYGQHYIDEVLDMYHRLQLTTKQIDFIHGYIYIDPKTINFEIPPRDNALNDITKLLK